VIREQYRRTHCRSYHTHSTIEAIPNLAVAALLSSDTMAISMMPLAEGINPDLDTLFADSQGHARAHFYAIAVLYSKKGIRIVYRYSKSDHYHDHRAEFADESKRRRNTGTTKTNCPF
jgi:hypothetical protein